MNFKCECGKEFSNPQSFAGHKTHCKQHQIAKYGSLKGMYLGIKRVFRCHPKGKSGYEQWPDCGMGSKRVGL